MSRDSENVSRDFYILRNHCGLVTVVIVVTVVNVVIVVTVITVITVVTVVTVVIVVTVVTVLTVVTVVTVVTSCDNCGYCGYCGYCDNCVNWAYFKTGSTWRKFQKCFYQSDFGNFRMFEPFTLKICNIGDINLLYHAKIAHSIIDTETILKSVLYFITSLD